MAGKRRGRTGAGRTSSPKVMESSENGECRTFESK